MTTTHSIRSATRDNIAAFAKALHEADGFTGASHEQDVQNLLYFLEKPHKWEPEYAIWLANGRPMDDSEDGWDAFLAAVDSK